MPNTTWNASDKSANITLTGSNLIATTTSVTACGVRAVDKQITGKFYWEVTCTTFSATANAVGIAAPYVPVGTALSSTTGPPGICGVTRSGQIWVDGVGGAILGVINAGVLCTAFDAGTRLIWFRLGAAGNWNNSATANPATAAGGVLTTLGQGVPAYPYVNFAFSADTVTANFGDSAFTGTVPSGFTSGFTAGATSPTNTVATQSAIEQWATVAAAIPSVDPIKVMVFA